LAGVGDPSKRKVAIGAAATSGGRRDHSVDAVKLKKEVIDGGGAEYEAYASSCAAAMRAKYDVAPDGHKVEVKFECQDGSLQTVYMFVLEHDAPTDERTECLVNAANPSMQSGCAGINLAISKKFPNGKWEDVAGFDRAVRLSPGDIYLHRGPPAGEPPFIFQALGPDAGNGESIGLLVHCYTAIAHAMVLLGAQTIIQTCISTAIYRHDPAECAQISVESTRDGFSGACAKLPAAGKPIYVWFSIYSKDSNRNASMSAYAASISGLRAT
jgi:O-acetyl-ADP-ribose deacetylase (regulator of RNase III)